MKKLGIIFLIFSLAVAAKAQDRSKFLYAEVADQSVTLYPFYKVFGSNFDPAITLGGGLEYRKKEKTALFQTLQLTGFSTRIIGDGLNLTTSIGYRYAHGSGLFGEAMVGAGFSVFYSARQTFSVNDDGNFEEVLPIHFITSVPADILLGYDTGTVALYLKYRYMIQGPYTGAMPALPTSLLGLGLRFNL